MLLISFLHLIDKVVSKKVFKNYRNFREKLLFFRIFQIMRLNKEEISLQNQLWRKSSRIRKSYENPLLPGNPIGFLNQTFIKFKERKRRNIYFYVKNRKISFSYLAFYISNLTARKNKLFNLTASIYPMTLSLYLLHSNCSEPYISILYSSTMHFEKM